VPARLSIRRTSIARSSIREEMSLMPAWIRSSRASSFFSCCAHDRYYALLIVSNR
jgi:hypothetical protein